MAKRRDYILRICLLTSLYTLRCHACPIMRAEIIKMKFY